MVKNSIIILLLCALTVACSSGPEAIILNADNCYNCKMTIADATFACEFVNDKGRAYKFDDIHCLLQFAQENSDKKGLYYVSDFESKQLIDATKAFYLKSEKVRSPMNGYTLSFLNEKDAQAAATQYNTTLLYWQDLKP